MSATEGTEPFTVERLRGLMAGGTEAIRECSSILWAADEIERLRAEVVSLSRLLGASSDPYTEERDLADELAAALLHSAERLDRRGMATATADTALAKWREARA